jgi:hypothetical protein
MPLEAPRLLLQLEALFIQFFYVEVGFEQWRAPIPFFAGISIEWQRNVRLSLNETFLTHKASS